MSFPFRRHLFPVVRASSYPSDEPGIDDEHAGWLDQYKKLVGFDPDTATPAQRLRRTWDMVFGFDLKSWEFQFVTMSGLMGLVLPMCYGMLLKDKENEKTVMRLNAETQFDHWYLAQRKMRDQKYLKNIQFGWKIGWRVGLMTSLFSIFTVSSLSYREYVNPLDFAASFGLVGGLWRWQKGPKGALASATLLGMCGLFIGCILWTVAKVTNADIHKMRNEMGADWMKTYITKKRKGYNYAAQSDQYFKLLIERDMLLQQRLYEQSLKKKKQMSTPVVNTTTTTTSTTTQKASEEKKS